LWRKRRWRYLLMRIDNLPRNSRYLEALSLDEDLAAEIMKMPPPKGSPVRMRDWSPELETLTLLVDRLGELIKAVVAVQGGKPPKIALLPRPKTAAEELRDPRRMHRQILSKVLLEQPDGSLVSAADDSNARHGSGPPGPAH
jgi:hypothetical protein